MLPSAKQVIAFAGVSKTAGATASGIIDRLGADFATIDVTAGTADVVSNTLSVLKLQESDTTVSSTFADISGFKGGTDFTIANALTSLPNGWKFNVDCRGRKRYIQVVASPQATMVIAATANLFRNEQAATTASKAGVLNLVEG